MTTENSTHTVENTVEAYQLLPAAALIDKAIADAHQLLEKKDKTT